MNARIQQSIRNPHIYRRLALRRSFSKWTPPTPSSNEQPIGNTEKQDLSAYDVSATIKKRPRDFELVETSSRLRDMVQALSSSDCMAIDSEGVDLGQPGGALSLLQIATRKGGSSALSIFVVDITLLDWRAFHHRVDPSDSSSPSLKSLLESQEVTKLIFDARSDASALSRQFNVRLRGCYDLQLAEVAVRQMKGPGASWLMGLDKALGACLPATPSMNEDLMWGGQVSKTYHQSGKMQVWKERPLSEELLQYAVADVRYLHKLRDVLDKQLPSSIVQKVKSVSASRIRMGALPGVNRAAAPDIVSRADFRQMVAEASSKRRGSEGA